MWWAGPASTPAEALSRGLRSPALAVALLLAIAVVAAAGTFLAPPADGTLPETGAAALPLARIVGLQHTFQSPPFLALVALAAVNVIACTWHRLAPGRRRAWSSRAVTDLVLHGSLLLILAGGIAKGLFGSVGTQNVYVGEGTATVFDWRSGRDAPLGFVLRAEELRKGFYPVRARIGVRRAATREQAGLLEVAEGTLTDLPGEDLRLRVAGYDDAAGVLRLGVVANGQEREIALATRPGDAASARAGAYELTLIAYRAQLKEIRVRVSLVESGATVAAGWLTTNSRLRHRGLSFFLTGWGEDAEGRRYCGFQTARDPGAPFFWAGCVLLALAVPWHFWVKGRRSS